MPLTRRGTRTSSHIDDPSDIEIQKEASVSPRSSAISTGPAKLAHRFWSFFRWSRILRLFRTNVMDDCGRIHRCGVLAICLGLLVFAFVVLYSAPPGKNYWHPSYWRRSHSLTPEQIKSIRHSFPIHIRANNTDDTELIVHPGYLFADKERMKALLGEDFPWEHMTVPKYWNPVYAFGEYEGGVREFLGDRGKYLITPTEADTIGSFYDGKETIFIAIASYRDPECLATVESIFSRAKHPERIRVAIADQRTEGDDDPRCRPKSEHSCQTSPNNLLCRYVGQIDYMEYPSEIMVGPVFARHIANRMYRGEYFAMQVDSHVRFVGNWDNDIIDQWNATGNEMAVISTYMTNMGENTIDPETHESLKHQRSLMCVVEYEWTGIMKHLKFGKQPNKKPKIKDSPMLHPFWAAGFSFGRGHFIISVPYDHYLPFVFQGEEILQTIRGFSFGYDYYAPSRNVAFHIYAMKENLKARKAVPKFTENEALFGRDIKTQSYLRLIGITGTTDPALDYLHLEEELYGLGRVRSREHFFNLFGIHPSTTTIEKNLCQFVEGFASSGALDSMHVNFIPFLRYDKMGIDYTRIAFRHKENNKLENTKIDEKELVSLRALLRKKQMEFKNETVNRLSTGSA